MPRVKEPVDIKPGTKTKESEIGAVKGVTLAEPIKFVATWVVPTVDELVNLLSSEPDKVLTEIAEARMANAVSAARANALSENEPREVKIERFIKFAEKMNPGKTKEFYKAQAEAFLGQDEYEPRVEGTI